MVGELDYRNILLLYFNVLSIRYAVSLYITENISKIFIMLGKCECALNLMIALKHPQLDNLRAKMPFSHKHQLCA